MTSLSPSDRLRAACVQMTSTTDPLRNIALASERVRAAAADGAELVMLPEVTNLMQIKRAEAFKVVKTEGEDPSLAAFRALAAELGIWLHVGSLAIKLVEEERFANRGFLIGPDGLVRARYDKIHMFDVDLTGGESYRESNGYRPGDRAVLVDTPWGGYGMAICYDVRFPHLFRRLAKAGARILTIPAAFTAKTGMAHWHVLLRARAIENGCFLLAAAQCGTHEDGRQTYGHALIISPWGEVIADGGERPGHVIADLDLSQVEKTRAMVPSLANERGFAPPMLTGLAEAGE